MQLFSLILQTEWKLHKVKAILSKYRIFFILKRERGKKKYIDSQNTLTVRQITTTLQISVLRIAAHVLIINGIWVADWSANKLKGKIAISVNVHHWYTKDDLRTSKITFWSVSKINIKITSVITTFAKGVKFWFSILNRKYHVLCKPANHFRQIQDPAFNIEYLWPKFDLALHN